MTTLLNERHGIKLMLLLAMLLVSNCCTPKKEWVLCESYVLEYVEFHGRLFLVPDAPNTIEITYFCDQKVQYPSYNLFSTGKDLEIYKALCTKHNDLTYNKWLKINTITIPNQIYPHCDFNSIYITSDKDFDTEHPAGKDLGDIVRFISRSPKKFIDSGYSKYYRHDSSSLSEPFKTISKIIWGDPVEGVEADTYPIDKLVSELKPEDLILLGFCGNTSPLAFLHFEKLPDNLGEHEITVTMITDDGEKLTNSIKMVF